MTDAGTAGADRDPTSPWDPERFRGLARDVAASLAAGPGGAAAAWRALGAAGLFAMPLAPARGGVGATVLDTVRAWDLLGEGVPDLGFLFAASAHVWGCALPLALHGSEAQAARWLPPLLSGEQVGAHCITEPGAGSDVRAMEATIRADGDGWLRLDGHKTFITGAPLAGLFVVYARDLRDDARGSRAPDEAPLSALIVEAGAQGLSVRPQEKLGLRGAPMGEVLLDGVRVPADRVLGTAGGGFQLFQTALDWERACIMAPFVGAMQRQLDGVVRRARTRRQFGQPISRFQAVAHRVADMKLRLDISRLLLHRAAEAREGGARAPLESSEAKLWISEAFVQNSLDALRIFGGEGYLDDSAAAMDLRDALGAPIFSGTSDVQRSIVARMLGL